MLTFLNQVIRITPKVAKLQNEGESCWPNSSTSVAATINFFSYDKKLIAAATVKTLYFGSFHIKSSSPFNPISQNSLKFGILVELYKLENSTKNF